MRMKSSNRTHQNVTGTFISAKAWLGRLQQEMGKQRADSTLERTPDPINQLRNVAFIVIGSEAGILGVPGNPDYAASKSAVQHGLILSLAPDAARICPKARVNAVCPGAVDTQQFRRECAENKESALIWKEAEATVALKSPVKIEDIAKQCLFLTSERWASSTTGQFIRIDGGKSGRLYWDKNGNASW
jgi:NAD(P)-dependent dehydrogenase (short-subunit alcohol dehydrogenase family)